MTARMRPASSPRHADRERTVHVDRGDELRVDLADQHHAHDVDGLAVGDAQSVAELALLAQSSSCRSLICGPPPCTTTGRMPTCRISTMSCAKSAKASSSRCSGQRVASVLDDDHLVGEATDVRQCLDQRCGAVGRGGRRCSRIQARPSQGRRSRRCRARRWRPVQLHRRHPWPGCRLRRSR